MAIADKVGIIVIHGMGSQEEHFSDGLRKEVTDRLGESGERFVWQEIYWADALEPRETELWNRMRAAREPDGSAIPLDWVTIREFVVHNFGDALAYHRETKKSSAYTQIHQIVSDRIKALKSALPDPACPVVVIAHSLGAHIISNYIWDLQPPDVTVTDLEALPTLTAMITFGCNIPLFSLSFSEVKPIDLPGVDVKKPELLAAQKVVEFCGSRRRAGLAVAPALRAGRGRAQSGGARNH